MTWPIPMLPSPTLPKSIDWRIWALVLLAVLGIGAAMVTYSWPQGRSTQSPMSWAVLFGLPLCLFAVLFGCRLNQWEEAQLEYEEQDRESERLKAIWNQWACCHMEIAQATTFLGGIESIDDWSASDAVLPVNLDRACGFAWLPYSEGGKRAGAILELVGDRMSVHLERVRELDVVLLLDDESIKARAKWSEAADRVLAHDQRRINFSAIPASSESLNHLQERMEAETAVTTLFIAFQFWHDASNRPYSEGGAAILMRAKARPDPLRSLNDNFNGARVLRPMLSLPGEFESDLTQLLDIQFGVRKAANLWLGAVSKDAHDTVLLKSRNHPCTADASVRELNVALGMPGPASAWIALAIAVEIGLKSGMSQLVAVDNDGERTLTWAIMQSEMEVTN